MALSSKEKKELQRRRRDAAKEAQKYHREQTKRAKKSSEKTERKNGKPDQEPRKKRSVSKIEEAVNSGNTAKFERISREEKFRRESEERIRNLKPEVHEDGYYIDEYSEKQKSEKRARVIRKQEREVIRRSKKPMTQKQIKLRRILISAALCVVVLITGVVLSLTVLFKTEKIEVEGSELYYDDQIEAFSNLALQKNLFINKIESTPENIVKNLPYIETADISISIPDTVVIKVTEAMPAYVIRDGNGFLLISSKCRILDRTETNDNNLPELKCGEHGGSEVGEYIRFTDLAVPDILESVANTIKECGFDKVVGFDVSDTTAITLNYDNRILINIGVAEDIDYKLKTAQAIITRKLDPNGTAQIYGVLDVSTCSKNKVSRYKPSDTRPVPEMTQPASTVPKTTTPGNDNVNGGADYINYDYDYDYDENAEWDEDGEGEDPDDEAGEDTYGEDENAEASPDGEGENGGEDGEIDENYVWTPNE